MVQVHAAHGWLFSQFLSPVQNKRADKFGGSLKNRVCFLLMVLDPIRSATGTNFPVEIRISGNDMTENGLCHEDCVKAAHLAEDKIDLFNISAANHEYPDIFCKIHLSAFYPHCANICLAAAIKKNVKKPVIYVGSFNDPAQMEEIIAFNQADIVEFARVRIASKSKKRNGG
jgi:2,4-dienoyl-CoA reductase-like NADH-dependent reductase (Old Yellow Enzyme family)